MIYKVRKVGAKKWTVVTKRQYEQTVKRINMGYAFEVTTDGN